VVVFNDKEWLIGHNEDMPVSWPNKNCWLLQAQITGDDKAIVEDFAAFTYPGVSPGVAFGWNIHGIVVTINYLYPVDIDTNGVSISFICRDMLASTSIKDALARIPPRRASGVNINLASIKERRCVNIEVASKSYSITEIHGTFTHTNIFKVLREKDELHSMHSSQSRQERVNEWKVINNDKDISEVLGDTKDPRFPIYRRCSAHDACSTVASVLFDLNQKTARIYVDNPKTSEPLFVFNIEMPNKP